MEELLQQLPTRRLGENFHVITLILSCSFFADDYKIIPLKNVPTQLSEEWFAQRKRKITGSKLPVLLCYYGKEKRSEMYASLIQVNYCQPAVECDATRWGRKQESSAVVSFLEFATKNDPKLVFCETAFIEHPTLAECGATPDGILQYSKYVLQCTESLVTWFYPCSSTSVLEAKCPYNKGIPKTTKKLRESYLPQVILEAICAQVNKCDLVVWTVCNCLLYRIVIEPSTRNMIMRFIVHVHRTLKHDPWIIDDVTGYYTPSRYALMLSAKIRDMCREIARKATPIDISPYSCSKQ